MSRAKVSPTRSAADRGRSWAKRSNQDDLMQEMEPNRRLCDDPNICRAPNEHAAQMAARKYGSHSQQVERRDQLWAIDLIFVSGYVSTDTDACMTRARRGGLWSRSAFILAIVTAQRQTTLAYRRRLGCEASAGTVAAHASHSLDGQKGRHQNGNYCLHPSRALWRTITIIGRQVNGTFGKISATTSVASVRRNSVVGTYRETLANALTASITICGP